MSRRRRCKWCGRYAAAELDWVACRLHLDVERAWRALRP